MASWSVSEFLMSLLAHYVFNESPLTTATTAIDLAGGGSGDHDGSYNWMGNGDGIFAGGVGGRHIKMKHLSSSNTTLVNAFDNNLDFNILGEMTVSFWLYPISTGQHLFGISGGTTGEDDNQAFVVRWWASGVVDFSWEHSNHTNITVASTSGFVSMNEWQHVTIRRKLFSGGPNMKIDFYKAGVNEETYDNSGAGYVPPTGGSLCNFTIGKTARGWNPGGQAMADSMRFYDSAETGDDIATMYATEEAGLYGSPGLKFLSTLYDRRVAKTSSNHFGNIITTGERSDRENPGFFRITA